MKANPVLYEIDQVIVSRVYDALIVARDNAVDVFNTHMDGIGGNPAPTKSNCYNYISIILEFSTMGKGSRRRKSQVSDKTYADNYSAIFGKPANKKTNDRQTNKVQRRDAREGQSLYRWWV